MPEVLFSFSGSGTGRIGVRRNYQDSIAAPHKTERSIVGAPVRVAPSDIGVGDEKLRRHVGNGHITRVIDVDVVLRVIKTLDVEFLVGRPVGSCGGQAGKNRLTASSTNTAMVRRIVGHRMMIIKRNARLNQCSGVNQRKAMPAKTQIPATLPSRLIE